MNLSDYRASTQERDRTQNLLELMPAMGSMALVLASDPYDTYEQEEKCIHCGQPSLPPPECCLGQKILTKAAGVARDATAIFAKPHANWIHVLFSKNGAAQPVAQARELPRIRVS